jgi:hypothetical protein
MYHSNANVSIWYGSRRNDEYIKIGGTTALECLRKFCLRAPTQDDLQRILHVSVSEMRGFSGMIGSIDCMHWEWKNCPKAWEGQFTRGDKGTVILEAVASSVVNSGLTRRDRGAERLKTA